METRHRSKPAKQSNAVVHEVRKWQSLSVRNNKFEISPIDFEDSAEWRFEKGQLRHRTAGFFSLAGIAAEARDSFLDGWKQLIIVQRQTAINGFLLRNTDVGAEVLFQGRVEPGNVNGMQLAPTVQSTKSNYERLHGGAATPMVELFTEPDRAETVYDELQSEEATRYHGKYNRNVVLRVPTDCDVDAPSTFRWYNIDAIRQFAITSNILNTDARSVLSCMGWDALVGADGPFAGHPQGSFGAELRNSYDASEDTAEQSTMDLLHWLASLRVRCGLRTRIIDLKDLQNWVVEKDCIREREVEHGFSARQYRVTAIGREVKSWDQPLILSNSVGRVMLVGQVRKGVLHFMVKANQEVGFLEGIQLSASVIISPGETCRTEDRTERVLIDHVADGNKTTVLNHCRQSEEGGRFYKEENDYEIVLLDPDAQLPDSDFYRWVTLSQIRRLIQIPGVISIEFRGVLALLLAYI